MILSELCQELKNWFCDIENDVHSGTWTIESGVLPPLSFLQYGQYFRIVGSTFNDGVHQYGGDTLEDETFTGAIWAMRVPPSVIDLAGEIDAWIKKNGEAVTSPYQSESWGGYSYSLKSGSGESGSLSWQSVFAGRLNRWRKLCP